MNIQDAMLAAVDVLLEEQIPFMMVGSFSSNLYGIPRSTKDGDLVVELGSRSIRTITDRLGPGFRLDPQVAFDSVLGTARHVVDVIDTPFKLEFFRLSNDPHDQERFRRRVVEEWHGREIMIPPAEDVVIMKLRWATHLNRPKDVEDVKDVLSVQRGKLDSAYMERWCDQHGTRAILDEIRATIPPV